MHRDAAEPTGLLLEVEVDSALVMTCIAQMQCQTLAADKSMGQLAAAYMCCTQHVSEQQEEWQQQKLVDDSVQVSIERTAG